MLSDRRLCLALDEPQLCNGHMGVRAGPKGHKEWVSVCVAQWWGVTGIEGTGASRKLLDVMAQWEAGLRGWGRIRPVAPSSLFVPGRLPPGGLRVGPGRT